MSRILVFQHVAAEPLGTLDPLIRRRGHRIKFVNFERQPDATPSMDRYRGLIVLGGPMNVEEQASRPHLRTELAVIEQALAQGKPVLGICLGAQLLAHALGAPISRSAQAEIGWYELETRCRRPVPTRSWPASVARLPVFQWHSRMFAIPHGAVHLARHAGCAHQAFRYGSECLWLPVPSRGQSGPDRALARHSGLSRRAGRRRPGPGRRLDPGAHADWPWPPADAGPGRFQPFLDQIGRPRRMRLEPAVSLAQALKSAPSRGVEGRPRHGQRSSCKIRPPIQAGPGCRCGFRSAPGLGSKCSFHDSHRTAARSNAPMLVGRVSSFSWSKAGAFVDRLSVRPSIFILGIREESWPGRKSSSSTATSESSPISTRARRRPRSACSITPVASTRSSTCTTPRTARARPRPTTWSRNASAASRSRARRFRPSGRVTRSTSSTPRDTSTSRSK